MKILSPLQNRTASFTIRQWSTNINIKAICMCCRFFQHRITTLALLGVFVKALYVYLCINIFSIYLCIPDAYMLIVPCAKLKL